MLRVWGADSGPLPTGGGRRGVAHGLLALLRLRSTARSAPFLLLTGQTSLLQAGLCQVSAALTNKRLQANISSVKPTYNHFYRQVTTLQKKRGGKENAIDNLYL